MILTEKTAAFNQKPHGPRARLVRVSRRNPCPECRHTDWCSVFEDRSGVICMRQRSDRPTRNGGYLHCYFDRQQLNRPPAKPTPTKAGPTPERADVDHLDGVYCSLIHRHLVLSSEHRSTLQARGLSDEEIDRRGYRSTPSPEFGKFVARALAELDLRGVPGFYFTGGAWLMADFGPGILIPVRDERSRIQGFQVRRDEGLSPRYLWLSSGSKPQGTSPGSPVHYARPHLLHDAEEVTITEGALKADVTAHFLEAPIISAAGVCNFGASFADDLRAKFPNLRTTYLAFDADWRQNPSVRGALERLKTNLRRARFTVRVRTWPPGLGKGIDDYLRALSQLGEGREAA
jgi:hypothetical protein